ncbi:hypothetical protein BgiBS90_004945, partial [Biomphalaria glabrata]
MGDYCDLRMPGGSDRYKWSSRNNVASLMCSKVINKNRTKAAKTFVLGDMS